MGKTTLGYSYCKRWKYGRLRKFDVAAFVPLRETKRDSTKDVTFDDLLLQACRDDEAIKEELKHYVQAGSLSLLLVLDGWDEAPDTVRNSQRFIRMLHFISSQYMCKVLITSRPDSSVDLDVNRVEIVGFTKESIHSYFHEALRSKLKDEHEIVDGCNELENHLKTYPSIQSCCAIPLNAAIVAKLFLDSDKKPRTLPHTRYELFSSIVQHLINKEQEKHHDGKMGVSQISRLKDLPDSLRKPLFRLAFDHLKVIVISHDEMVAITQQLGNDANSAYSVLKSPCFCAVLQTDEKRDRSSGRKTYYYHFIHLSIQELLAAHHISELGEDDQVKMFQDLLDEPRFSSVLQFYAAFNKFTNQGVRDIVTGIDLNKKHILLTLMRCCFEAQKQLLYEKNIERIISKIIERIDSMLLISYVALTPFDCMSIGYFLAFALRTCSELRVGLDSCSIDNHSLILLLEEFSRQDEACPAGVLKGVIELDISGNNIGDDGLAHVATDLVAKNTMKILNVMLSRGISVNGAKSLGRALALNSPQELNISYTSIGDEGVADIATALRTNTKMKVLNVANCGISCKGAESLSIALAARCSSLEQLDIRFNKIGDDGITYIVTALETLKSLKFYDDTATDQGALSLVAALTTNTSSIKHMTLGWSSSHPENTLKEMAKHVRNFTLTELELVLCIPQPSRDHEQQEKEWYQGAYVGGKEFIQSLEDSCLKHFQLRTPMSSANDLLVSRTHTLLQHTTRSVNSARKNRKLSNIDFEIFGRY